MSAGKSRNEFLTRRSGLWGVCLFVLVLAAGAAAAEPADGKFHRAYYLEQAGHDWAAAAKLYEEVVSDTRVEAQLRSQAQARLAVCREELASTDLAKLMPPEAWAYIEIQQPGERLSRLLSELGLLTDPKHPPTAGEKRVAVSPALINGVLGLRGAALAITGFNPLQKTPTGVLVLNPGDVEFVRGLMETALPAGGQAAEPIEGYPTYQVEGRVFVTLTSRLAIASCERAQIKGVLDRLSGTETRSLAANPAFAEVTKDGNDSLVRFFVNAKAMMPMLKGMMAAGAMVSREAAMAQALFDIDSLDSLIGHLGIGDDAVFFELRLLLNEGHHNLVYNFFRTPAIDHESLKCVPDGAAALVAGALNEAPSRYAPASSGASKVTPPVTALDFGREIFGNIASFAVFLLPPDAPRAENAPPIPDVAAVITVNDPTKSEALWTQVLGIASLASGAAPTIEAAPVQIEGVMVRAYQLPDGVTIYFATSGNDVLIALSKIAMTRSIQAKTAGRSILKDPAYAASLSRLTQESTKAVLVHIGRCAQVARQFMPPNEVAEMEPFVGPLSNSVASFVVDHASHELRVSTSLTGIPDIGDQVAALVTRESAKHGTGGGPGRSEHGKIKEQTTTTVEGQPAVQSESLKNLKAKFKTLAGNKKDRQVAVACADLIFEKVKDDAKELNNVAWALLTEDQYGDDYADVALKFSERSNQVSVYGNWMFMDTLALAKFKTGNAAEAVALEKKAIELCGDCGGLSDLRKSLARFEAGLSQRGSAQTIRAD